MPPSSSQDQTTERLESLLNDPVFRPRMRYCTKAFTLWQRSEGPYLQLELVPPSFPLLRPTLEVVTETGNKRDLPVILTVQPDPSWQSPRTDGLGLLNFDAAGELSDLRTRWEDHISGTVRCTLDHLGRLAQLLEAHGREVDWVLTTDHLKRVSDLPISDWVWEVDAHPNLLVYDIAANFASAEDKAAEDDQSAQIAEPVESLDLLRQIRSSLEAGVKIRLF